MNQFLISEIVSLLPRVVEAINEIDLLQREHEEKVALKYSDKEYLKATYNLYKSGRINAEKFKELVSLLVDKQVTIDTNSIENELLKLIR